MLEIARIGVGDPVRVAIAHDEFVAHQLLPGDPSRGVAEPLHHLTGPGRRGILTGREIRVHRLVAVVAKPDPRPGRGALAQGRA